MPVPSPPPLPPAPVASGERLRISRGPAVASVLLGLAVLVGVGVWTYDPDALAAFAVGVRPGWLLAAAGTVVGRVVFGAWRLRHFSGGQIGWRDGVKDQVVWDFFAYVTPSTVGGGPILPAFIARDRQLPLGEATSVVLFAMLVDQLWFAVTVPVLWISAHWLDVFPNSMGALGTGALAAFLGGYLVWVVALAYGTLVRPDRLAAVVGWTFRLPLLRRFRDKAVQTMGEMEGRSRVLRSQPAAFYVRGAAISLVPWVCRYLLAVFVLWSVVPDLDAVLVFVRSAAMQLGALAVPTPGGAGGVEALYVLFLGPPLQPEALVAPTLLVWRFLSFYLFIAVGAGLVARHLRQRPAARADE